MKLRFWLIGLATLFSLVYFVYVFLNEIVLPPRTATALMKRYHDQFKVYSITVPPNSIMSTLKRLEYPPVRILLNDGRPKEPLYESVGKEYFTSESSGSRNMPEKIVRSLNKWSTSHPHGSATLILVPNEAIFEPEKHSYRETILHNYDSESYLASSGLIVTDTEVIHIDIIGEKIVDWTERPYAW